MALQIRRGPTDDREGVIFLEGEIIYDTDLHEVFIGDGTTLGGRPVTSYTDENAKDAAGALLTTSTGNVAFTYNPVGNALTANVTLDGVGISNVVEDTTPQLGGNLDLNSHNITGTGNVNITGTVTATSFSGPLTGDVTGNVSGSAATVTTADQPAITSVGTLTSLDVTNAITGASFEGDVVTSSITTTSGDLTITPNTIISGNLEVSGITTLDVVNINGLTNISSLPDAPTTITVNDSLSSTSQSPALKLSVVAASTTDSGPSIEFFVDTEASAEIRLARVLARDTADGPSISLGVDNGGVFNKYVEALANSVVLNDSLVITSNGLFNHTGALPTITPGTDITIYPEGNTVIYGNILPGTEGTPASGDYSLGSDDQRFKRAFFNENIVINGGAGTVPTTSIGAAGDYRGTIAVDDQYLYFCTANYDGVTNVWRRMAWPGGTW